MKVFQHVRKSLEQEKPRKMQILQVTSQNGLHDQESFHTFRYTGTKISCMLIKGIQEPLPKFESTKLSNEIQVVFCNRYDIETSADINMMFRDI